MRHMETSATEETFVQNGLKPVETEDKEPETQVDSDITNVEHNTSSASHYKALSSNITPETSRQYKPIPHFTALQLTRYWRNVHRGDGCWKWTGATAYANPKRTIRYGVHRGIKAHRIAYYLEHGSIPGHLTIDHICENTLCVRPDHLKPATMREQVDRRDAAKILPNGDAVCKWGHVRTRGKPCLGCANMNGKKFREKNPERAREINRQSYARQRPNPLLRRKRKDDPVCN